MATYFHGNPAEFQAPDGLQTLVLMNPTTYLQQQQQHQQQLFSHSSAPAPTAHHHNNLIFLNSPHAPPPQPPHHSSHHFVGVPTTTTTDDSISALHGLVPRVHYNLYNNNYPSTPARDAPRAKQGLSLSLSSQQQHPGFGSQAVSGGDDIRVSGGSASSGSGVTNGVSGMQGVLLSSKYLKAAQELLDEVVNVNNHNSNKSEFSKKCSTVNHDNSGSSNKVTGESSAAAGDDDKAAAGKRAAELTTAERQEIQMKKAKLINMLDEVEQRYRQYHHQMQIVIQSFEHAAGIGTAKTYTALALKTISKQFRCLKDAITGQIKAANKMLGEEDCAGGGKIEDSRLKFVDNHLRQQRALQQLGMIQHNAWRPQRGLPERSVSVLRAWLFEHFLHPYPKDSDKQLLAKQTGLTRSQVSNWFINARVRLWKPMVEEMYLEELKEQEQNGSDDRTSKSEQNEDSASKSGAPSSLQEKNVVNETHRNARSFKSSTENIDFANPNVHSVISLSGNGRNQQSGFSLIGSSELEGLTQGSPKKTRASNNDMNMMLSPANVASSISMDVKPDGDAHHNDQISMKFDDDSQSARDGYSFMGNQMNFIQGFGQYPIGEIGRFDAEQFTTAPSFSSGNGVSLTLGLPHCENLSLSATHHQPFLPNQSIQLGRRVEIVEPNEYGATNTQSPHSSAAYESINIQNRKRFAAQLLPDFVA